MSSLLLLLVVIMFGQSNSYLAELALAPARTSRASFNLAPIRSKPLSDLDSQVLERLLEDNPEYLTNEEVQRLLGETEHLKKEKAAEKEAYEATLPGAEMNSQFGKFLANWETESGSLFKKLQDSITSFALAVSNTAETLGQAIGGAVTNQFLLSSDSSYEGVRSPSDYVRAAGEAFESVFSLRPSRPTSMRALKR